VPFLAYAPGAYLGQVVEFILKHNATPVHLDRVYETDMAEGLKAMAREGHGVAFLPQSAVQKDLQSGKLVSAGSGLDLTLDIRLYREHPGTRTNAAQGKRAVDRFWDELQQHLERAHPTPAG
jgi:DNA-binding transcriptional LysR family regulator